MYLFMLIFVNSDKELRVIKSSVEVNAELGVIDQWTIRMLTVCRWAEMG